jgi:hypothetical protein
VSPHIVGFNAPKEQRKIRNRDLDSARLWRDDRKLEDSDFKPLVKNKKTVIVPEQQLQPVASSIAKHEEMSTERIAAHLIAYDSRQAIEREM